MIFEDIEENIEKKERLENIALVSTMKNNFLSESSSTTAIPVYEWLKSASSKRTDSQITSTTKVNVPSSTQLTTTVRSQRTTTASPTTQLTTTAAPTTQTTTTIATTTPTTTVLPKTTTVATTTPTEPKTDLKTK